MGSSTSSYSIKFIIMKPVSINICNKISDKHTKQVYGLLVRRVNMDIFFHISNTLRDMTLDNLTTELKQKHFYETSKD